MIATKNSLVIVLSVVVLLLQTVSVFVGAQSSDADLYISQSFAIVSTPPSCSNKTTASACNATSTCYWTGGGDSSSGACAAKTFFAGSTAANDFTPHSWCFEFFPLPFISAVFFACAFFTGASLMGAIYCYLYYDVFSRQLSSGETVYNQFYYKTWPIATYCSLLFAVCACLGLTAWLYWLKESICAYVPFTFLFLIAIGVFFIGYPVYRAIKRFLARRINREACFDIDDHVAPTTRQAMPQRANQVRCF